MSTTTRRLAICADDFGLSESISTAILTLIQRQRLTSVSCITNAANFTGAATSLRPYCDKVETGLHFNLTEGRPLSSALAAHWPVLPSLGTLILRAHLHTVPREAIQQELEAQWQAFQFTFGKAPDFIDGHQHIHDLPVIRELILSRAQQQQNPPWIRNTGAIAGPGFTFKRRVIEFTGGRALQYRLRQQHIHCNTLLLGVYDFTRRDYRALMRSWLAQLPDSGGLIFCHPGLLTPHGKNNVMAHCRAGEHHYFSSDDFIQDLQAFNVKLQPLNQQK